MSVHVRQARPTETLDVRRILDAAMLEPGDVEARTDAGDVLVAVESRGSKRDATGNATSPNAAASETDPAEARIRGALVLEPLESASGAHVPAVAVRRRHRGRGVGTALVEAALEREGRLTVRFDEGVTPFYESLGFSIEPIDDERRRGTLVGSP